MDLNGPSPIHNLSDQPLSLQPNGLEQPAQHRVVLARLFAVLLPLTLLVAACAQKPGQPDPDPRPFGDVRLEQVASGFSTPVALATTADGSIFVVEKAGVIRIVQDGAVLSAPFLDLSAQVANADEQGMVGLAFPPDYATSGAFYVYYTSSSGRGRLARFHRNPESANQALPTPEVLIDLDEASRWHNGGQLAFGPDGYLYWAVGDATNTALAQNLNSLRGKILRLDVSGETGYEVPASNPFVGDATARPEIWALGLRNPWRFSFDHVADQIYIADVGQSAYEEVNVSPADTGGFNYGWPIREGNSCYEAETCGSTGLTAPAFTYAHTPGSGRSITGGYVYRGASAPDLVGKYVFADFITRQIYVASAADGWQMHTLLPVGESLMTATFGEGPNGELYVANMGTGTVFEITQRQP